MPAMLPELHDVSTTVRPTRTTTTASATTTRPGAIAREGDPEMAVLARRNAMLDRELADVDRDMARLERRRAA
jgi:hypothetical protein